MLCPICIAKGYSKDLKNDEKSLIKNSLSSQKGKLISAYKIPIIK